VLVTIASMAVSQDRRRRAVGWATMIPTTREALEESADAG
jgi:hypothetical protein